MFLLSLFFAPKKRVMNDVFFAPKKRVIEKFSLHQRKE
jgi:hypothetical protein